MYFIRRGYSTITYYLIESNSIEIKYKPNEYNPQIYYIEGIFSYLALNKNRDHTNFINHSRRYPQERIGFSINHNLYPFH